MSALSCDLEASQGEEVNKNCREEMRKVKFRA